MTIHQFVFCSVLVLILAPACYGTPRIDFDKVYAEFQSHEDRGEWKDALASAEQAYSLGRSVFGERSINTGNLAFNYGQLLNRFKRFDEARPVLLSARKILQKYYGQNSFELVDVLVELGIATYNREKPRIARAHFKRALGLAATESAITPATMAMKIGIFMNSVGGDAEVYFEVAHEGYLTHMGVMDARTALAAANLGRYALLRQDYAGARTHLQSSIKMFESEPANRAMELRARQFLVLALEELGESELATQHCLIIGSNTVAEPNATYLPIYLKSAVFPKTKLQNGWAVVELAVDENGFTRNHRIVDSSSSVFEAPSIAAVEKFRYAPQFKNGVAIVTEGVQIQVVFEATPAEPKEGPLVNLRSFGTRTLPVISL